MRVKMAMNIGLPLCIAVLVCGCFCFTKNFYYIRKTSPILPNINTNLKLLENGEESSLVRNSSQEPRCHRQIQVWQGSEITQPPTKSECPGLKCGISFVKDRSFETLTKSDAVILFHLSEWSWEELQRKRPVNQAWVFYSMESPPLTGRNAVPPTKLDRIYNYTMSYRPSSTIHAPYAFYNDTFPQNSPDQNKNWAEGKTRLVAWASSKCPGHGGIQSWQRREFVQTLAKRISVDMYGACGDQVCAMDSDECWARIKAHKFYLALENNECRDYITEKFWWNALLHDIVPIVYGPPREDYERVAPPKSFIHLQDFKNLNELVDYITLLDSNDALYNAYFEWKKQGSVRWVGEFGIMQPQFMCKVVSKLLDDENRLKDGYHGYRGVNPSIHNYWSTSCIKPTGFPLEF